MDDLLRRIVKYKIKYDDSKNFTLRELKNISEYLGISLKELAKVLGIKWHMVYELTRGTYQKAKSNAFLEAKQRYFSEIEEEILNQILQNKMVNDFTSKFFYPEMEEYEARFGINKKDLARNILGIKNPDKSSKIQEEGSYFFSVKYKEFKEEKLTDKGKEILDSFLPVRMKRTGSHMFTYVEIQELSKIYRINPRDFMVYVLGRSEQLYYDFVAGRHDRCYSQKYKQRKEQLIIAKRENFMADMNPNVRTYFSLKQLEQLAKELDISLYDLVTGVMQKSRQNYSRIVEGSEKKEARKKLYVGEYKSGPLPKAFCEKNIREIMAVIKIATRSAIGYMKVNGFSAAFVFYYDLMQECYLYLMNHGNPMTREGQLEIISDKYDNRYGAILYKKAYYFVISKIKEFQSNEMEGQAYDIHLRIKGKDDEAIEEYEEEEDIDIFIDGLTSDDKEKSILKFFSLNMFNEDSMKVACKKFHVTQEYINRMFERIRGSLSRDMGRECDE